MYEFTDLRVPQCTNLPFTDLLLDEFDHFFGRRARPEDTSDTQLVESWHVHVGDSNRLPPGGGHLDFAEIVRTLREIGYAGYLSAELLAEPDPDAAAQATIEHLRRLIPN